jgi:hypothetical protein
LHGLSLPVLQNVLAELFGADVVTMDVGLKMPKTSAVFRSLRARAVERGWAYGGPNPRLRQHGVVLAVIQQWLRLEVSGHCACQVKDAHTTNRPLTHISIQTMERFNRCSLFAPD